MLTQKFDKSTPKSVIINQEQRNLTTRVELCNKVVIIFYDVAKIAIPGTSARSRWPGLRRSSNSRARVEAPGRKIAAWKGSMPEIIEIRGSRSDKRRG